MTVVGSFTAVVGAVLAASLVAGCSGGDEPVAAEATSTTPTPSPTPTPTIPEQTPTQYGTNTIISNWDEYYDNPVVQAYREFRSAAISAITERRNVPELEQSVTETYAEETASNNRFIWSREWTVAPEARATIESVKMDGTEATLVSCELAPSTALKNADGSFVDESVARGTMKTVVSLERTSSGQQWLVDKVEVPSEC